MAAGKSVRKYKVAQSSVYLITSDGLTLELPIPSRSPNDPLRWSLLKRATVMGVISLFTIVGLILVQGTSLLLFALENEYPPQVSTPLKEIIEVFSNKVTEHQATATRCSLFHPLSLLGNWSVDMGTTFNGNWSKTGSPPCYAHSGRRHIPGSHIAELLCAFYRPMPARDSWGCVPKYCERPLLVILSTTNDVQMILTVIDLTFIHQRPQWIGLFWCMTTVFSDLGLALTPTIISVGGSWRAFYWAWLGPCVLLILLALFWAPETSFKRPPMAFDGHIISQAETGKIIIYDTWEEVPGGKPFPEVRTTWKSSTFIKNIIFGTQAETGGWLAMKAFPRQLMFCTLNPLVLWVMLLNTFVFGAMVITCQTYAQVLMSPPYNFSFSQIGLAKISPSIGAFLAYPVSGILTTYLIRTLASRNRGVREPEHYLASFFIPITLSSVSLALFGIATERRWDWRWILLFVGLDYLSAIATFSTNVVWITESFPEFAGAAIVVVGAGSYGTSFALSSVIAPWFQSQGLGNTYIELGIVTVVLGFFGFPIHFWGKRYREYLYARWSPGF